MSAVNKETSTRKLFNKVKNVDGAKRLWKDFQKATLMERTPKASEMKKISVELKRIINPPKR